MSNLCDDEDDLTDEPQYTHQNLGLIYPSHDRIIRATTDLAKALKLCKDIVVAAYKVLDYVPLFQNDKQSAYWKNTVIPILVQYLTQDVSARSLITQSFDTVRDLAQVIQSAFEIVRRSEGSKRAIEFAKKNIPAAFDKLNQCIASVEQLNSEVSQESLKLIEIFDPSAARLSDMKLEEELDERIVKLISKQQSLKSQLYEVERDIELLLAEKREKNALDKFGLDCNTLILFLVQMRIFAWSLKPGESAYAPLTSILNGIKVMVESHVDLLSSDERCDIFLAGTLLNEQVKFISEYAVSAQKIMRTADDYDQSGIEQRMQNALKF